MGSRRSPNSEWLRPGGAEQQEQVHLGDAELDVLALGREAPFLGAGDALALEHIGEFAAGKEMAAIDPGAEIGRDGDVGRGGDDAARHVAVGLGDERRGSCRRRSGSRSAPVPTNCGPMVATARRGVAAAGGGVERDGGEEGFERGGRLPRPSKRSHSWPGRMFMIVAQRIDLGAGHLAGVIVLVAGERRAPALDGVGDEDGGRVAAGAPRTVRAGCRMQWPPRLAMSSASSASLRRASRADDVRPDRRSRR